MEQRAGEGGKPNGLTQVVEEERKPLSRHEGAAVAFMVYFSRSHRSCYAYELAPNQTDWPWAGQDIMDASFGIALPLRIKGVSWW